MRKFAVALAVALGLTALGTARTEAAVKLHGLFTDNMVLQQKARVPIWGTADDGTEVTVELQGQTAAAKVKNGQWRASLNNLKAGGPFTLTVRSGDSRIELKDVLVGEVWVASGQSNMEWPLLASREPQKAIEASANPKIRLFQVPKVRSPKPLEELGKEGARWVSAGPKTVPGFTAVGYFFARDLQKKLKVPVGIIQAAWGGTAAEEWTSAATLQKELHIKPGGNATTLYNGMITPITPYAIKGVIWYQGESNAGRADQYFQLFSAMIQNWRQEWHQGQFPFLFVQLAPWDVPKNQSWAFLREAQLLTMLRVPNTAMAVITDYGDPRDIHPKDKEPVGARLALAALALAYHQDVEYSGPLYDSKKVEDGKVRLSFKHVGGGLQARGGELKGFEIAGADGKFVPAQAAIEGENVIVSSPQVSNPTEVRYGWANHPEVNLYNREGLPASPFRTNPPKSK